MKQRLSTKEFIARAKKTHGEKYDYSKVEYVNQNVKVCIICPEHGEFWQTPNNHLAGKGCPECADLTRRAKRRKGVTAFVEESAIKHNKKYDYSKVEYKNNCTKVCIVCPEHGEFWQTPQAHLRGQGCPKCSHRSTKYLTEEWIGEAKKVHGDKYDYSKVEYIGNHIKVCIICKEHGEFWQDPAAHLRGQGCPKCADIFNGFNRLMGKDKFIEKSNKIHNNQYDYSKVKYVNSKEKVCIICPKHGEFWQRPSKHLMGQGCPICKESALENKIKMFLNENKISYEHQYRTEWLKNENNNFLSVDFYLPDYNVVIECQGIQHFKSVKRFGGGKMFNRRVMNDKIKKKLCEMHNIRVLYITEKKINTSITLYNSNNTMLINEITINKIKNASC